MFMFDFCCGSSDTLLSHVEQLLRAVILKISVCDAVLDNNPPGTGSADLSFTTQKDHHTIDLFITQRS